MNQFHPSKIIEIATANPGKGIRQKDALDFLLTNKKLSTVEQKFYKLFLSDEGIETRYLAVNQLEELLYETAQDAIERFESEATKLGEEAIRKCLLSQNLQPSRVDALIVTTCTGYLCPGLTSYLSEKLGFRDNLQTYDLTGLGCGAAMPALRTADQYLKLFPGTNVLVVCIEVSSAAIYWGQEIDLILSNAIFGDGAAACLLTSGQEVSGLALKQFENILWPQYRDDLRFKHREGRLCNVIKRDVPNIAAMAVKELYCRLSRNQNSLREHYAIHPGGRKILDEIQNILKLEDSQLHTSRSVLRKYGNMSSPSVLFVLKELLAKENLTEEDSIFLFSFGAGFTAFGATFQIENQTNLKRREKECRYHTKKTVSLSC